MIRIYIPTHYPRDHWDALLKKGYRLQPYIPYLDISEVDAEGLLRGVREVFGSFHNFEDEFIVIAKIICPNDDSVCLRMDRDYYDVYRKGKYTKTLAIWQFPCTFHGYRQDELWCNMVALSENHTKSTKKSLTSP